MSARNAAWWTFGATAAAAATSTLVVASAFIIQRRQFTEEDRAKSDAIKDARSAGTLAASQFIKHLGDKATGLRLHLAMLRKPLTALQIDDATNIVSTWAETIRFYVAKAELDPSFVFYLLAMNNIALRSLRLMEKAGGDVDHSLSMLERVAVFQRRGVQALATGKGMREKVGLKALDPVAPVPDIISTAHQSNTV